MSEIQILTGDSSPSRPAVLMKTLPACGLCAAILLAAVPCDAGSSGAGVPAASIASPAGSALTASLVKTGLYLFSGSSNSLLRLSANGLIVVDGQAPADYDALLKRFHKISDQPVRVLINTDHHAEHTSSNSRFLADGTQILAHENVKKNLARLTPAGGEIAAPTKTYSDHLNVKLGGIEVQVMHFGNACTDGDSIAYFPNLKVVAVGDLFAAAPNPDYASGGSLVGWASVLAEILKLDFDVVVPGKGPTVGRADLEAFKAKIDTLVSRAAGLVQRGVRKDQLMARLETQNLGWKLTFDMAQLDGFYAELTRMK